MEPFAFTPAGAVGLFSVPAMEELGFACVMTTRLGGVSRGEAASMNLSFKRRDSEAAVRENYRLLAAALGRDPESFCISRQTHGTAVLEATAEDARLSLAPGGVSREGDAWISDSPALTLLRHHADCTPIFLADPGHRAMALVHAGWRGTVDRIAAQTVEAMVRRYGSRPRDLRAVIGPAIDRCCFQIGEDVISLLEERFPGAGLVTRRDGSAYGDLKGCNRLQLAEAGLLPENILTSSLCTACRTDVFYSHRREKGHTGSMASVMYLL